jgi:hypothetical protein
MAEMLRKEWMAVSWDDMGRDLNGPYMTPEAAAEAATNGQAGNRTHRGYYEVNVQEVSSVPGKTVEELNAEREKDRRNQDEKIRKAREEGKQTHERILTKPGEQKPTGPGPEQTVPGTQIPRPTDNPQYSQEPPGGQNTGPDAVASGVTTGTQKTGEPARGTEPKVSTKST